MQRKSIVLIVLSAILIVLAVVPATNAVLPLQSEECIQPVCIGPGPVERIQDLFGSNFEMGYMLTMYQQNADIGAMALFGSQRAGDSYIRALSRKMALERIDMNQDLRAWYLTYMSRNMPPAEIQRFTGLQEALSTYTGTEFDCMYASVMIGLMQQSQDAADMAIDRSEILQLRQQALVVSRTNENEIQAFQRWQNCMY